RLERALAPDGDDEHLDLAVGLLEPQRLLDRVHVEWVERALAGAVEPLRLWVDPGVGGRFGHVFRANGDLHAAETLQARRIARVRDFGREPEPVSSRRTTARALLLLASATLLTIAAGASAAGSGKPPVKIIFPLLGRATYTDDFGEARPGGPHQGIDMIAPKRTLALAAEAGR